MLWFRGKRESARSRRQRSFSEMLSRRCKHPPQSLQANSGSGYSSASPSVCTESREKAMDAVSGPYLIDNMKVAKTLS